MDTRLKTARVKTQGKHMMANSAYRGNTLTEYGLVLACIAVLLSVSLTPLGNATAAMLASIGKNLTDSGSSTADPNNPNALIPGEGTSGNMDANGSANGNYALSSDAQGQQLLLLLNGTASGAVNATSIDGDSARAKVGENIELMQQLKQVLADSNNPELQSWAEINLIRRMQWLTASEGYAADMQSFKALVPANRYNQEQAIKDIAAYQGELSQIMAGTAPAIWAPPKPANVDPATWQKISNIVDQVANNAKTLASEIAPSTPYAPEQNVWKGVYNVVVSDAAAVTTAITQAQSDGTLASNAYIADTVDKAAQLQHINMSP
jgi:Flp pilus assembly pilin Flp